MTEQLREFAAQGGRGFVVAGLLAHRWNAETRRWEVEVLWEGYPRSEATWEPFIDVLQDAPLQAQAYVSTMKAGDNKEQLMELLEGPMKALRHPSARAVERDISLEESGVVLGAARC